MQPKNQVPYCRIPLMRSIVVFLSIDHVSSQCSLGSLCPGGATADYQFGSWLYRNYEGYYYVNLPYVERSCNYFVGGCGFFSKAQISTALTYNMTNIRLNTIDGTFRSGAIVQFGECGDCNGIFSASGCAEINLTGTPFGIEHGIGSWNGFNGSSIGTSGWCTGSQACTLCCGGDCGQGYFNGVLKVIDTVPFSEAVQTACAIFPTDLNLACIGTEIALLTPTIYCGTDCVCANSDFGPNSAFNRSSFDLSCRPGWFFFCGECVMCSPGSFSSVPGSTSCLNCDLGKISTSEGQSSCLMCHPGTYRSNTTFSSGLRWALYSGYFNDIIPIEESPNFTYLYTEKGFIPDGLTSEGVQGLSTDFSNLYSATGHMMQANKSSYFTIEWQGYYMSNITGTITFYLTSDDASYLWFDTPAVVSNANAACKVPGIHPMIGDKCQVDVKKGEYYHLRILYGQSQAACDISLCFELPGSELKICNGLGFFFHEAESLGTACELCAAGSYTQHYGSSNCSTCYAGKYADNVGSTSCSDCPRGTFAAPVSATCAMCPSGEYSSGCGSANCSQCAPGSYTSGTGLSRCAICDEGTFSSGSGSSSACASCLPGSFAQTCSYAGFPAVHYNGSFFTALDVVDLSLGNFSNFCQSILLAIPQGWSIAPDDAASRQVITAYPWGVLPILLSNGSGYDKSTANLSAARNFSTNCLVSHARQYQPCECNARILMKCSAPPANFSCPEGASSCVRCAAGSFSAMHRASSCTLCAIGTFSRTEGTRSVPNFVCIERNFASLPVWGAVSYLKDIALIY